MGLLAIFAWLFGCNKTPKPAQHELSEISGVSLSCGHMDRSYSYSFWLHLEEDTWLFDAECFTHDFEEETVFEGREVSSEDMDALFEILERNDRIAYAENYQKPSDSIFEVMDETTYGFCLTFSDGSQYVTYDAQDELRQFFYRLAEIAE